MADGPLITEMPFGAVRTSVAILSHPELRGNAAIHDPDPVNVNPFQI